MGREKQVYWLIETVVKEIRDTLRPQTVGDDPFYPNYAGLCYQATHMFLNRLEEICTENRIALEYRSIHGELKHNPRTESKHWHCQHQWCEVKLLGQRLYVDCTSSQFQDLYSDIPEYYISDKKPKWFYDDRRNPAYSKFGKRLVIRRRIERADWGDTTVEDTLFEFIQYDIWGPISDFMRKILRRSSK